MLLVKGKRAFAHAHSRDRVPNVRALEDCPVAERWGNPLGNNEAERDADSVGTWKGERAAPGPHAYIVIGELNGFLKGNGAARYPSAQVQVLVLVEVDSEYNWHARVRGSSEFDVDLFDFVLEQFAHVDLDLAFESAS